MFRIFAITGILLLAGTSFDAFSEWGGGRHGGGGHEGGHDSGVGGYGGQEGGGRRQQREQRQGEALLCAQQLGITMPAAGSGTPLTSAQWQQIQSCVQTQRQANQQAAQSKEQADLAACAQQLGITLPAQGAANTLTHQQRQQLRQCVSQDRKAEHQTFEQAVQACLTANGITPSQPGQAPVQLTPVQRQQVDECVAQAANQAAGSSAVVTGTSTSTAVDSTTATATDTTVVTSTGTATSTSTTSSAGTLSLTSL